VADISANWALVQQRFALGETIWFAWTPEIRELRQLRDENTRLKQVVADLTLDRNVLQDVLKKSGNPVAAENGSSGYPQGLAPKRAACLRDPIRESPSGARSVDASERRWRVSHAYQRSWLPPVSDTASAASTCCCGAKDGM
jgi:hypothetical protein